MRIKKHANGNEYLLTEDGIWVRNFHHKVTPVDINALSDRAEYGMLVANEVANAKLDAAELDPNTVRYDSAVVVSDGFGFDEKQSLLAALPGTCAVLATNRSARKWRVRRKVDFFVVNNPYPECMLQMPQKYFPRCLASTKTFPEFLKAYDDRGVVYRYSPVAEKHFAPAGGRSVCLIDDYRNPVCAAIGFARLLGAKKLLLFCCDDSFNASRPGAEQLPNGLWMYPQQRTCQRVIGANLYWYARNPKSKTVLADHSSGPEYADIPYIPAERITEFLA